MSGWEYRNRAGRCKPDCPDNTPGGLPPLGDGGDE